CISVGISCHRMAYNITRIKNGDSAAGVIKQWSAALDQEQHHYGPDYEEYRRRPQGVSACLAILEREGSQPVLGFFWSVIWFSHPYPLVSICGASPHSPAAGRAPS